MILFYEHEKKSEDTKLKKWLRRITWTVLVMGAVMWGGLLILSSFSGPNKALCDGIAGFLTQQSQMQTHVGRCTYMSVYPRFRADIGDITMDGGIDIAAVKIDAGFWDVFFNTGNVNVFDVSDIDVAPGIWGAAHYRVSSLSLQPDPPRLEADIARGGDRFRMFVDAERQGDGFRLLRNRRIHVKTESIEASVGHLAGQAVMNISAASCNPDDARALSSLWKDSGAHILKGYKDAAACFDQVFDRTCRALGASKRILYDPAKGCVRE